MGFMAKRKGYYDEHKIDMTRHKNSAKEMELLPLTLLVLMLLAISTTVATGQAPPECNESCGNISIPYPFGLTDGCYLYVPGQESQQFKLACDTTVSQPTLNFLDSYNFPTNISNIIPSESALQVMVGTSRNCYNGTTYMPDLYRDSDLWLPPTYTVAQKNKLYNIGCQKVTLLNAHFLHATKPQNTLSGQSFCMDEFDSSFPNNCTGFGCSVNSIPSGVQNYTGQVYTLGTRVGTTLQWSLDYPCSFGFVVDERNFTFAGNLTFTQLNTTMEQLPVLADWAIGSENCEAAKKNNETTFACKDINTICVDRADGYFCQCHDGFEGNPYLLEGCQDIDECKNTTLCSDHATCVNSVGSYKCDCHKGYRKDDHDSNKCVLITETANKSSKPMKILLGVCLSFLVLMIIAFLMYHIWKKREFKKLTKIYMERNGSSLLEEKLRTYPSGSRRPQEFTLEELKKATESFSETQEIGKGTYAIVYKGTLQDKKGTSVSFHRGTTQEVAIKKSRSDAPTVVSQSPWQFVNELLFLSTIDDKNFVCLLGYCLQSRTPMLVYEYVGNGTLDDHIRKRNGKGPLSLWQRMKIATEIAGSLANLHDTDSTQIKYQDQERCRVAQPKTTNILLDNDLTTKVSEFTASKFVPRDPNILQATPGGQAAFVYVDPEYFESFKLTEKSDVYSYGVILVELLTSFPPASFDKTEDEKNLVKYFLTCMGDGQLDSILDKEIIKDDESVTIARQVAKLAQRCLCSKGVDRPTMGQVKTELGPLLDKCPGGPGEILVDSSHAETRHLLAASPSNDYAVNIRSDY